MRLMARKERTPGLPPSPPRRGGAGRAASLPFRASVSRAPSLLPALRSAHTDLGTSAAAPRRSRRHCRQGSCGGRAALGARPRARRTRRRCCCCRCRRNRGLVGRGTRGGRTGRARRARLLLLLLCRPGRAQRESRTSILGQRGCRRGAGSGRAEGGAGRRQGGKEGGPAVSRRAARAGARRGSGDALPTADNHRELPGCAFRPCVLEAAPGGRVEPRRRLRVSADEAGAAMLEEDSAGRGRRPGGRASWGGARGCACAHAECDPRAGRCEGREE